MTSKPRDIADIVVDELVLRTLQSNPGQVPVINALGNGIDWVNYGVNTQTLITDPTYTLTNADFLFGTELKKVDHADGCVVTIPALLTPQDMCTFFQQNTGQITFQGAPGVTLKAADDYFVSRIINSFITIIPDQHIPETYLLVGSLTL